MSDDRSFLDIQVPLSMEALVDATGINAAEGPNRGPCLPGVPHSWQYVRSRGCAMKAMVLQSGSNGLASRTTL